MSTRQLFTYGNPKTAKGEARGYLTAILHLAPYTLALARRNVCADATAQCVALCLNTAGRGGIFARGESTNAIQEARIRKTRAFFADRNAFLADLERELWRHCERAKRYALRPCARLNGTSDLAFESLAPGIFENAPRALRLYDYTKSARRMRAFLDGRFPARYSLTFSRSESNQSDCDALLAQGANVAVVFSTRRGEALPREWRGARVIDGDKTDLRFLDPRGVIVGLRAKGKARRPEYQGGVVVKV